MKIDKKYFNLNFDIKIIRQLLNISMQKLADELEVDYQTVYRWENGITSITDDKLESLYSFAYKQKIRLNTIKEQLYTEEFSDNKIKVLFHGSKSFIDGDITINNSKNNNDFGAGFYCGESFIQSAMFVSNFINSSLYIISFDTFSLKKLKYEVNQDWMLTIAYFRGTLNKYSDNPVIKNLISKVDTADYIIAPIADNRMFQIIDEFISGFITDEQCKHCLSATNLGYQYVFKTQKALNNIKLITQCYISKQEINQANQKKEKDKHNTQNKVKIAKIHYRGKGKYIDEILQEVL